MVQPNLRRVGIIRGGTVVQPNLRRVGIIRGVVMEDPTTGEQRCCVPLRGDELLADLWHDAPLVDRMALAKNGLVVHPIDPQRG